jgi:hypothetical protein
MRVAEDRARWRKVGEAYVQQWAVTVLLQLWSDDDDDDDGLAMRITVDLTGDKLIAI